LKKNRRRAFVDQDPFSFLHRVNILESQEGEEISITHRWWSYRGGKQMKR